MKLKNILIFSWKNLWSHRLRTTLTVTGVSIGIAAIVFLVSLGFGLEKLVTQQVANFEAFTSVDVPSAAQKSDKISPDYVSKVKALPHINSVNEIADMAGRIKISSQNSTTETVAIATDSAYFKMSQLTLQQGRFFNNETKDEIVVSGNLASLLGYGGKEKELIGQLVSLDLILPQDLRLADSVQGPVTKSMEQLKITGITGDASSPVSYISLKSAEAQGLLNRSSLKLKVDNKDNVASVRKMVENLGLDTEYVGDTLDQISQVFVLFRIILGGFGLIALIVAALGTFNTLTISLMERIREVGLLKTLGMNRKGIFQLFITESFTIGLIGGIIGLALGSGLGWILNFSLQYFAERAGSDNVEVYYSPVSLIVWVGVGSLVIGFLTGLYPAIRAIKTKPLDSLRYE